jgi:Helicase HerA, central domain
MPRERGNLKHLHLSNELSLPLETVTQAIGILAKRRAGKSYAARRFGEQLFKAGQQIVVVDPKGDWCAARVRALCH